MNLGKFSITAKILAIVGLLSALMLTIAIMGIISLGSLDDAANEMETASGESLLGALIVQNVIRLNRAQYRIAADPSPQEIADAQKLVDEQKVQLTERFAEVQKTAGENQRALLAEVITAYDEYVKELDGTFAVAERNSASIINEPAREAVLNAVRTSAVKSKAVNDALRAYVSYTDEKVEKFSADASAIYEFISMLMIGVSIVAVLLGAAAGFFMAKFGVVKPVQAIVACLKRLSEGDLEVEVFGVGRKDEVGTIAETTQIFKDNLIKARELEAEQKREQEARLRRAENVANLVAEFDKTVAGIVEGVSAGSTELRSNAESLSAIAEETNKQSIAVSAASEQATTSVETVASAAEQLTASISEINQQINGSLRIAQEAVDDAKHTNTTVEGLRSAAEKIGQVVGLIQDIAEQTNLLALNATIEAARAGEAGKGFAVVASEVKSLANQTAKATEEIATQVQDMQSAAGGSVTAIEGIGKKILSMNESVTAIASAAEEQAAATQEISRNVQQAASGTREVATNITGVSQASGETGRMSSDVLAASSELSKQAELLRQEVDSFIENVKSAA